MTLILQILLKNKVTEIEGEIPSITGLASSELTAVENKISDVSSLVKKTDYNTKVILKRKLLIIIMVNTLLLQNLIPWQQVLLMQD